MSTLRIEEEKIIKKNIIRIFDEGYHNFSIRETTLALEKIGIKRSPQVIKRLLLELAKKYRIRKVIKKFRVIKTRIPYRRTKEGVKRLKNFTLNHEK